MERLEHQELWEEAGEERLLELLSEAVLPREADHKVIKQNKKICFEVISDRSELCPVVATVAVAEQRSTQHVATETR